MSHPADNPDLSSLLAHAGWMRRLARHLVREEALAEDLVQDTWLAVARHPPEAGRPARPWLAEILRNVVRMHARGQRRRQGREEAEVAEAQAQAGAAPLAADAVLERMQLQRLVADAIMALDEPYRSTLLLRFYEEQSATAIGRLQGVPAGTVRWRIKEGLDRLRARLDARHPGGRRAWVALLAPLARTTAGGTFTGGALVMAAKSKTVGVAAVVILLLIVGGGLWWAAGRGSPAAAPPGADAGARAALPPPRWSPAGGNGEPGTGTAVAAAVADAEPPPPAGEGFMVKGRVMDSGAGGIMGARVIALEGPRSGEAAGTLHRFPTTTDRSGAYALRLRAGIYSLQVQADGYAAKGQFLSLTADTTADFLLEPGTRLSGRVVLRENGEPVAGMRVLVVPVDPVGQRRWSAITDDEGHFVIQGVASAEWRLEARQGPLAGSTGVLRVIPALAIDGIEIRVARALALSGRVVGPDGRALAGMAVTAEARGRPGWGGAATDAGGNYRLEGLSPGVYDLTMSGPNGAGPRTYREATLADRDLGGIDFTMPAPVVLEGRLLDQAGAPVAQTQVWAEMGRGSVATTDQGGRFAFTTLDPGPVQLGAERQPDQVARWGPQVLKPGERREVTLRFATGATLAGKVTYPDGAPAAGATVVVRSPDSPRTRPVRAQAGADGRYLVRGLVAGRARADARRRAMGGALERPHHVQLSATAANHLDLLLPYPARIQGTAFLVDGRPATGAVVVASTKDVRPPPTHALRATVDIDGRFTLEDLDQGARYHLWADLPGFGAHGDPVVASEGTVVALRLVAAR